MSAYANDNDFSTSIDEQLTRFRAEHLAAAAIDSVRRVVDGMAFLPGRKSVIILSNLPIRHPECNNGLGLNTVNMIGTPASLGGLPDRFRRLVDAPLRVSVVFYAIDTRLLGTPDDLSQSRPILSAAGSGSPNYTNN